MVSRKTLIGVYIALFVGLIISIIVNIITACLYGVTTTQIIFFIVLPLLAISCILDLIKTIKSE